MRVGCDSRARKLEHVQILTDFKDGKNSNDGLGHTLNGGRITRGTINADEDISDLN